MSLSHTEAVTWADAMLVGDLSASTQRLFLDYGQIASTFMVELLEAYSRDRDLTDSVILAALVQNTTAAVASDPSLERRYGQFEAPVPEDFHRTISVNALATSLGLPFETLRRRLKRMTAEGLCAVGPRGVRASWRLLTSDAHRQTLESVCECVRRLHQRLERASGLQCMNLRRPAGVVPFCGASPVRIVYRTATRHFLRTMELLLPQVSSVTQAFIVLEILAANTEVLSQAFDGAKRPNVEDHRPDGCGRPIRACEMAARLSLPPETARRQLAVLVDEGRCRRIPNGAVTPAALLTEPKMVATMIANVQNLRRLFDDLAATGVLARWEMEQFVASA